MLLGVLGVVVVGLVVVAVLVVRTVKPPIDATNAMLRDVRDGRYAEAYEQACSRNQEDYTLEEFTEVFETTFADKGPIRSFDVYSGDVDGNRAVVEFTIDFGITGEEDFGIDVLEEDGDWRPCLLE